MTRLPGLLFAALAIAMIGGAQPSTAQTTVPPELINPNIVVVYGTPDGNPAALAWLKDRKILERVAQFLSPVKLPRKLTITSGGPASKGGCPETSPNMYFQPGADELIVCYSYITWWQDQVARGGSFKGIASDDILAGGLAGVLLHEAGHALSSLLELPVLGREEDAADQIAAFLMLQFSPKLSSAALKGFAYSLVKISGKVENEAELFFDTHGTPSQRFYNTLCIAYGKNPTAFTEAARLGEVPPQRLDNCKREYEQVKKAFERTILPHLDLALVEKVRSVEWVNLGAR